MEDDTAKLLNATGSDKDRLRNLLEEFLQKDDSDGSGDSDGIDESEDDGDEEGEVNFTAADFDMAMKHATTSRWWMPPR